MESRHGSLDDQGAPDSWELADLDESMKRLLVSSKSSQSQVPDYPPDTSTGTGLVPSPAENDGVLAEKINQVDQFLREAIQNPRERLSELLRDYWRLTKLIYKLEARCGAIRKSMEEYISLKTAECERVSTEIENNEHDMKKKEIEAYEHFKKATTELENVTKRYDEEIQVCSNELLRFLDAIAKHKEHVESTISTVKTGISEVVQEVNSMYTRRNKA